MYLYIYHSWYIGAVVSHNKKDIVRSLLERGFFFFFYACFQHSIFFSFHLSGTWIVWTILKILKTITYFLFKSCFWSDVRKVVPFIYLFDFFKGNSVSKAKDKKMLQNFCQLFSDIFITQLFKNIILLYITQIIKLEISCRTSQANFLWMGIYL